MSNHASGGVTYSMSSSMVAWCIQAPLCRQFLLPPCNLRAAFGWLPFVSVERPSFAACICWIRAELCRQGGFHAGLVVPIAAMCM